MPILTDTGKIRREIEKLKDEQAKAFRAAVFMPMTRAEAHQCDERRKLITRLVDKLAALTRAR